MIQAIQNFYQTSKLSETLATANVTHASIAAFFPQYDENVGSIVVSCIFLTAYAIVLSVIGGMLIRYRKELKKNQVIIFLMVSWCMIQQSIALLFRLGYNGKALSLNLNYSDYTKIEDLSSHLLPIFVCSAFEGLAVYLQGVVIVVITCFILNMFLDTARIVHAISAKTFKIFKYLFNTIIAIFAISILFLVLADVGVILASKIVPEFTANVLPILIVVFLAFTIMISIESLMFIFVGVKLILFVRKNSLKIGAQATASFLQRPETKIAGLIIGMLVSAYFQLLAAIVGIMTTFFNPSLHFIDYSLQAGGILLFSIFVLLVYNPLVSLSAKEGNSSTDSLKSESIKSDRDRSEKLASQRKSNTYPNSPIRELDCVSPTTTTSGGGDEPTSEISKI